MRVRDKKHLAFVRSYPCMNCKTDQNVEAHHLLKVPWETNVIGLKIGDQWAVPLCRTCRRDVHDAGGEVEAWGKHGMRRGYNFAVSLWKQSEDKR